MKFRSEFSSGSTSRFLTGSGLAAMAVTLAAPAAAQDQDPEEQEEVVSVDNETTVASEGQTITVTADPSKVHLFANGHSLRT